MGKSRSYHLSNWQKLVISLFESKVTKTVIQQIMQHILKEYDKLFLIFVIYSLKFKIIIFPMFIFMLI